MRKGKIVRLILRKIQIQIDERRHQVGFTCTHRQTEKIICVRDAIENLFECRLVIYFVCVLLDIFLQFRRKLFAVLILETCVLEERNSGGCCVEYLTSRLGQFHLPDIRIIEPPICK